MKSVSLKQRIEWVDVVKYICMMCIIMSHLEASTMVMYRFWSPFYLMGFFFVSGYVYKNKYNFKQFIENKAKTLLWPWLFFSVGNILIAQVVSFNQHEPILKELIWNFLQIRTLGDGAWFLAAIFIAFIPFYYVVCNYENRKSKQSRIFLAGLLITLSVISSIYVRIMPPEMLPWNNVNLPWHGEYIFQAVLFMYLGYLFREKYEEKFDRINNPLVAVCLLILYIIIVYAFPEAYTTKNLFYYIFHIYIRRIVGVMMIVSISKLIKSNAYTRFVGQNTLLYFVLQGKIYSFIQALLRRTVGEWYSMVLGNLVYSSIFDFVGGFIMSFVLIIPVYIINTYFPILIGKQRKK
ncbi:MAG: hypothetical protein E7269_07565 [Lachnospiraceae bacterium]|nr:hypothetical protein [Lachnospiraceae bacterium]